MSIAILAQGDFFRAMEVRFKTPDREAEAGSFGDELARVFRRI